MNLVFPEILNLKYNALSQKIRVISESWLAHEMYCPVCGCDFLAKLPNNTKVADFRCDNLGKTILDGAYYAALERITSRTNPNLFVLGYRENIVENLTLVPKYFFTPDILQIRKPLSQNARRAGYIGSNILYGNIPAQGKIAIIESRHEIAKSIVMRNYTQAARLKLDNMNLRGWLLDILRCLDKITHEIFSLDDIYKFESELVEKHPENHNITAKIRQQLQFLRDKGFIEFSKKYYRRS